MTSYRQAPSERLNDYLDGVVAGSIFSVMGRDQVLRDLDLVAGGNVEPHIGKPYPLSFCNMGLPVVDSNDRSLYIVHTVWILGPALLRTGPFSSFGAIFGAGDLSSHVRFVLEGAVKAPYVEGCLSAVEETAAMLRYEYNDFVKQVKELDIDPDVTARAEYDVYSRVIGHPSLHYQLASTGRVDVTRHTLNMCSDIVDEWIDGLGGLDAAYSKRFVATVPTRIDLSFSLDHVPVQLSVFGDRPLAVETALGRDREWYCLTDPEDNYLRCKEGETVVHVSFESNQATARVAVLHGTMDSRGVVAICTEPMGYGRVQEFLALPFVAPSVKKDFSSLLPKPKASEDIRRERVIERLRSSNNVFSGAAFRRMISRSA